VIAPITVLVFNSGRVVFPGLKRVEDIYTVLDHIPDLIKTSRIVEAQKESNPSTRLINSLTNTGSCVTYSQYDKKPLKDRCKAVHRRKRRVLCKSENAASMN
jgi:hypothetical protein